jgi:hypothetical protein
VNRAFCSYYQSKDSDYVSFINAILYLIYLWDSILIDDVSKFSLTSGHVNLFFTACETSGGRHRKNSKESNIRSGKSRNSPFLLKEQAEGK